MKRVKFITLGCKVNQYDTQVIREQFLDTGFKEIDNHSPADIYIINTCTVTHRADSESFNLIRKVKRENSNAKIIVTGCLTELDEDKIKKIGDISLIVKNRDKEKIIDLFNQNHRTIEQKNYRTKTSISYFKGHTRVFIKIQDGCNNFCSYCKVPRVRGISRSRPLDEIVQEAKRLVKNGFQELVLCGICLGAYGKDLLNTNSHESPPQKFAPQTSAHPPILMAEADPPSSLAEKAEFSRITNENYSCKFDGSVSLTVDPERSRRLDKNSCKFVPKRLFQHSLELTDVIEALEKIEGLLRIRLSSIEAGDISNRLIKKMTQSKKLCQHLHIPIQSGDDEILKKMNRNYSRKDYLNLIKKVKNNIPEIAITTDVLVGFPGENEENFQNTVKLIKEILPLRVHIFPYSKRLGTQAAILKERINPLVIKERTLQLASISKKCALAYKKRFLNKDSGVLIEERSKEDNKYWEGYTDNYIKVWVESDKDLKNQLIRVRLKKISEDISYGVLY